MTPNTMNVVEMREPGAADVLTLGRRPVPELKPDEVLIRVIAAGVNGPDLVQRRGHYPAPKGASDLLGLEASGEIIAVGADVKRWAPGDRVVALANGGAYAEYVAVQADHCLPVPDSVIEVDAAGLPETYFTVWSNIFHPSPIREDGLLLVHGGAGGIGSTAIQLGKAMGLRVFTTAGSDADCAFCLEIGADRVINFQNEDFVAIVREAGGADAILDIIGGDYISRNIKAARHDARIVQIAFNKGSKIEIDLMPLMLKRLMLTGSTLRSRSPEFKALIAHELEQQVWPLFAAGKLKTLTHRGFSNGASR